METAHMVAQWSLTETTGGLTQIFPASEGGVVADLQYFKYSLAWSFGGSFLLL